MQDAMMRLYSNDIANEKAWSEAYDRGAKEEELDIAHSIFLSREIVLLRVYHLCQDD